MLDVDIMYVFEKDAPGVRIHRNTDSVDVPCPACGGKRTLNINTRKQVFRCNKCDTAGNAVQLHMLYTGIEDYKEALRDLTGEWKALPVERKKSFEQKQDNAVKPVPLAERNRVYQMLLSRLTLREEHLADLYKRGLTHAFIESEQFRSTVQKEDIAKIREICKSMRNADYRSQRKDSSLWYQKKVGIPGFYFGGELKEDGTPGEGTQFLYFADRKPGYFIPVRTLDGQISGFQIRYDPLPKDTPEWKRKGWHKYANFASTEKSTGCPFTGSENVHHTGFAPGRMYESICLTEGCLKADIASQLSDMPFIAVLGVSVTSQLLENLKELKEKRGTKKILVCFDMDYREKKEVDKALKKTYGIIREAGLEAVQLTWNPMFKGIDDYLLARMKGETD